MPFQEAHHYQFEPGKDVTQQFTIIYKKKNNSYLEFTN